uniref:PKD-like domain-containing protein n=1 Tax=Polaribacter sp. TaxID=1920175 RepID=UPI0025EA3DAE
PGANNSSNNDVVLSDGIFIDSYINLSSSIIDVVYTIVPISAKGCEGDEFTVTVEIIPEPVVADQGPIEVCSDEAIGITLNPSTSVAVATYNVININSNGLSATSGVTNTEIDAEITSDDGLKDDSYSNNSNNPVDVVYTIVPVSAQDVEGAEFTVTVTVNPKPIVANQAIEVCSGETIGIDFNESTTIAVDKYSIKNIDFNGLTASEGNPTTGTNLSANEIADDAFVNTTNNPVDVTYTIVPVSSENCEGEEFTVTVTVNPQPVVTDQIEDPVNSGAPIEVTLDDAANGLPITNYRITNINNNGLTPGANNSSNNDVVLSDGIFIDSYINLSSSIIDVVYTIVPISAKGCEGDEFTVTVEIIPEPVVADQGPIEVCSDEAIGITLNPSTSVAVATYNVININSNGLSATSGVTNTEIDAEITSDDGLKDDSYSNNSNNPVDVVYTIVPVSAQDVEGAEFTVTVTVNPKPIVANQAIEVCSGETIGIDFNESTTIAVDKYSIKNIDFNGLTASEGNPTTGTNLSANEIADDAFVNTTNNPVDVTYTIVPVSSENCEGEEFTVTVTVNPKLGNPDFTVTSNNLPTLLAVDDITLFKNTSKILVQNTEIYSLSWFIDGKQISTEDEFEYEFKNLGVYTITLEVDFLYVDPLNNDNNYICTYSLTKDVEVTETFNIVLPNAFTPNNDGINDTIRPIFKNVQKIEMSIYDIWGVLIYFESGTTSLKGWDGYVKGKLAGVGNYTMIVKGKTSFGKNILKSTSIRIIR